MDRMASGRLIPVGLTRRLPNRGNPGGAIKPWKRRDEVLPSAPDSQGNALSRIYMTEKSPLRRSGRKTLDLYRKRPGG
jgi:hypothetical protein